MKKIILLINVLCITAWSAQAVPVSDAQLTRRVNRATRAAVQRANDNLIEAVENLQTPANRLRTFLKQGADPCRALPLAIAANNALAVQVLSEYKHTCNWKNAVEQRLHVVMQKNKVDVFNALMADNQNITCPDPFSFTPAQSGSQWHALSKEMLSSVNRYCFPTRQAKTDFLRKIILLKPWNGSPFDLAESYHWGIRSVKMEQRWLESVDHLVNEQVPVSADTLQDVIALSRLETVDGNYQLLFEITRRLVNACLKGGANGKEVLRRLDSPAGAWAWKHYSSEERMRLSNLLERKPETQPRNFTDRIRHMYSRL